MPKLEQSKEGVKAIEGSDGQSMIADDHKYGPGKPAAGPRKIEEIADRLVGVVDGAKHRNGVHADHEPLGPEWQEAAPLRGKPGHVSLSVRRKLEGVMVRDRQNHRCERLGDGVEGRPGP